MSGAATKGIAAVLKVSPALAKVIGKTEISRPQVINAFLHQHFYTF
jgi:hypothetical protein